jgi:hypothetical protein
MVHNGLTATRRNPSFHAQKQAFSGAAQIAGSQKFQRKDYAKLLRRTMNIFALS